jgi:hypothetical protein
MSNIENLNESNKILKYYEDFLFSIKTNIEKDTIKLQDLSDKIEEM